MVKTLSVFSLKGILFLLLLGTSHNSIAQNLPDTASVQEQFEFIFKESNNYQNYKVVPSNWLEELQGRIQDSLGALHQQIGNLQKELDVRKENITGLRKNVTEVRDSLNTVQTLRDSVAFFGFGMSKSTYSAIMWSGIAVLFLLLLIFIIRFNHSNAITVKSRDSLASMEEEFEQFRKRSLEREQKLRRELQDEINKQHRNRK